MRALVTRWTVRPRGRLAASAGGRRDRMARAPAPAATRPWRIGTRRMLHEEMEMEMISRKSGRSFILLAILTLMGSLAPLSGAQAQQEVCPDTLFLGDYPPSISRDWTENIQGVAHDQGHWFITSETILLK